MTSTLSGARMRSHNGRLVLATLRDQALSRRQLAGQLGLTPSAITRIVADLMERGLVEETGKVTAPGAGRPHTTLGLSDRLAGIGIDARVDRTVLLYTEMGGTVLHREELPLSTRPSPEEFTATVAAAIRSVAADATHTLTGVGMAFPGQLTSDRQGVARSHYLGWEHVSLVPELEERLGLPVGLRHVAECAAIANARQPELEDCSRLLHVQVGAGLGLAMTRNRDLDETLPVGWGGGGHVLVGDPTRPCVCGRRGCVDTVVGFEAIAAPGRAAGITVAPGPDAMQRFAAEVGRAADDEGQPWALAVVDELTEHLARAMAVFVSLEVPDRITLGGYPLALGARFLDGVSTRLAENLASPSPLVTTSIGDRASSLGAAMVGLNQIMTPTRFEEAV
ncbi:MAG: ROK family protein [Propionibacteriaceae bacterium]|nr:ROK family protein [Propionibacteriaceae bacterium]